MIRWFICGNKATDMKESAQIEILRKYSQDVKGDSQTREWIKNVRLAAKQFPHSDPIMRLVGFCICEASRHEDNALKFNDAGFLKCFTKYFEKLDKSPSTIIEILSATINITSVTTEANLKMNPDTMELLFKLLIDYRDHPLVVSNSVACFTNLTRSADDNDFWTDSRIRYIIQLHDRYFHDNVTSCKIAGLLHNMTMNINVSHMLIDNDGVNSIMNAIRNINPADFENSESIRRHCCTLLNMCSLDAFFEPFLEAEGIENLSWLYSIENEKYEEFHEIINTIYAILRVHPVDDCSLHIGIQHNFFNTVHTLLFDYDVCHIDGFNRSPLDVAVVFAHHADMVYMIAACGGKFHKFSHIDFEFFHSEKLNAIIDGQNMHRIVMKAFLKSLSFFIPTANISHIILAYVPGQEMLHAFNSAIQDCESCSFF